MTPTRTTQARPIKYDEATLTELGERRAAALRELEELAPLIRAQVVAGAGQGLTAYRLAKLAGMTTTAATDILRHAGVPTARRKSTPAA